MRQAQAVSRSRASPVRAAASAFPRSPAEPTKPLTRISIARHQNPRCSNPSTRGRRRCRKIMRSLTQRRYTHTRAPSPVPWRQGARRWNGSPHPRRCRRRCPRRDTGRPSCCRLDLSSPSSRPPANASAALPWSSRALPLFLLPCSVCERVTGDAVRLWLAGISSCFCFGEWGKSNSAHPTPERPEQSDSTAWINRKQQQATCCIW
jgi:hypothetical protein